MKRRAKITGISTVFLIVLSVQPTRYEVGIRVLVGLLGLLTLIIIDESRAEFGGTKDSLNEDLTPEFLYRI